MACWILHCRAVSFLQGAPPRRTRTAVKCTFSFPLATPKLVASTLEVYGYCGSSRSSKLNIAWALLGGRDFEIKQNPMLTHPTLWKDPRSSDFQSVGCFRDLVSITNDAFFSHFSGPFLQTISDGGLIKTETISSVPSQSFQLKIGK